MASTLPRQHRALVLESVEKGFQIKTVQTPEPTHGDAIVQVLVAGLISYSREIYNGERKYAFPTPLVPGASCIGRIAQPGPDATLLKVGQLVFVDCVIRGRDDPSATFLSAVHEGSTDGSRKLMREIWRDGPCAEYAKVPLENCIALDEERLCQGLGYSIEHLNYMDKLLVPYGGLRDIGLEPGETVIISPATGGFGGAGVLVALAMGARVIAMGRNELELARIKSYAAEHMPSGCVETVRITGDETADAMALRTFGTIDKILDLSPPTAAQSSHMKSALMVLRHEGKVSLMGFADVTSSPTIRWNLVGKNIILKGKLMYSRDDMLQFVKMLERGLFPRGDALAYPKVFQLHDYQQAFDAAANFTGLGRSVMFKP